MSTMNIENGNRVWRNEIGQIHREDGPAIEWVSGSKEWFLHGKRHRIDGPSIDMAWGHREWKVNGKLHREDGPAIEWAGGEKDWYFNGKLHREDGPAIECQTGYKEWWVHGKRHRKDGPGMFGPKPPSVEYEDGKEWCIYGIELIKKEYTDLLLNHVLKLQLLTRVLPVGAETLVDKHVM